MLRRLTPRAQLGAEGSAFETPCALHLDRINVDGW